MEKYFAIRKKSNKNILKVQYNYEHGLSYYTLIDGDGEEFKFYDIRVFNKIIEISKINISQSTKEIPYCYFNENDLEIVIIQKEIIKLISENNG